MHNSGWTPSPERERVAVRAARPGLEGYVRDVVGTFAEDDRVMARDLDNEPGNVGMGELERVAHVVPVWDDGGVAVRNPADLRERAVAAADAGQARRR